MLIWDQVFSHTERNTGFRAAQTIILNKLKGWFFFPLVLFAMCYQLSKSISILCLCLAVFLLNSCWFRLFCLSKDKLMKDLPNKQKGVALCGHKTLRIIKEHTYEGFQSFMSNWRSNCGESWSLQKKHIHFTCEYMNDMG